MRKNKKASLNYIKERVWSKLQGWKEKLLSQAGREVLIKAVVQAIPTFAMGFFKLPMGLCHDIEMLIQKFWWGEYGERRKIHSRNWESLCKHKLEGGLGFKDLVKFNEAMLAKQVWRLLIDKSSLFFRVFSTKYFPTGPILDAKSSRGSFAWRSILKARHVIKRWMLWRIGDGKTIRLFCDNWIPGDFPSKVVPCSLDASNEATISTMIDPDTRTWNDALLQQSIAPFLLQKIKAITI